MSVRTPTTSLNCMDKALLALDCRSERMLLHWVITLSGGVDPNALRAALLTAAARHPVLRSTIATALRGQLWEARDLARHNPLTVADVPTQSPHSSGGADSPASTYDSVLSSWMNRPLDPAKELSWRVLLLRSGNTTFTLVFTFHHSATDGLGALRFVTEVIRRYNGALDEGSPVGSPPRGDSLLALAREYGRRTPRFRMKMLSSLCRRLLLTPFSPHGRVCRNANTAAPDFYFCQASLNPDEMEKLRARARSLDAKINDVLLAACFRAVDQWNAVHGEIIGRIDIMVPVDLGHYMPSPVVENRVSFISVSTVRRERANPDHLLQTVKSQRSWLLENGIPFSIVYAVSFCCWFPPQVRKAVARFLLATRLYLDSILVTNLGLIWPSGIAGGGGANRIGAAGIVGIAVIPPVVSPMGISLSACTCGSRLHVALTYKTSQFSNTEARLFLNLYLHEMRSYQRTPEGTLAPQVRERTSRETAQAR